ncbi:Predicted phospholipase, patatin/cPLA2 family [Lentibacillus halodurans]|uniref:Predicted phospholipase, patatin/cPLA2 family n=1 Tax=Lentibacillus halodurans TaxID=237679 RepID=A0A1I0W655_9BACI|nr:patatin family protein [Lentibacillus halodurans]SFA84152.1 Predicted phospholipase, patatin/cPLA2 family [Lentibacillus halodurans]
MEYDAGLMLEGGGMRCAFTVGVLDYFLDHQIEFPYVATASAGALIGSSYIAKQRDRNTELLAGIGKNRKAISIKHFLRNKELFSMDFIFDKLANHLFPLDFQSFSQASSRFIIGTTDINTGRSVFYDTFQKQEDLSTIIRASCSLPVLAPSVGYKGKQLVDGGVADPIPILPLMKHRLKKHVVILTRNKGYVKKPTKLNWFFKRIFQDKPELIKLLRDRHVRYNDTMKKLRAMEQRHEAFIIQPAEPLAASRIENSKQKLEALYHQGYQEAEKNSKALQNFLNNSQKPAAYIKDNVPS